MIKTRYLALSLSTLALVAASCSSSSSSSSAEQLTTSSKKAASNAGSVHFVDVTVLGKQSETITGEISTSDSQEALTTNGTLILEVRLVDNVAYVQAENATILESALGLNATQANAALNKWISVTSTETPYTSLRESLSISSAIDVYYPTGSTAAVGTTQTIHGVEVTPVSETTTSGSTKKSSTIFLAKGTNLPVAGTLIAKAGSTSEHKEAVYRNWGKPVTVVAPTGATSFSSIAG